MMRIFVAAKKRNDFPEEKPSFPEKPSSRSFCVSFEEQRRYNAEVQMDEIMEASDPLVIA